MENQSSSELSKLHGHPFSPQASIDRPYLSSSFREALSSLYYGLEYGTRVLVLSADDGLGKTTLLRYLERRVQQRGRILLVPVKADNALDTLQNMMVEIRALAPEDFDPTRRETDDVPRTLANPAKPFILLLDFNEGSAGSALEILKHLTKVEAFKTNSLKIVVALPDEAADGLQTSELARDILRVQIHPITAAEVEDYIQHRLRLAGWRSNSLFTPGQSASIAEKSSGKPSAINEICCNLLRNAESENDRSDNRGRDQELSLDERDVDSLIAGQQSAITRLPANASDRVSSPEHSLNPRALAIASIALLLVIAIAGLWYEGPTRTNSARRVNVSIIPSPGITQNRAIPQQRFASGLANAAPTTATGVAVTAAAARPPAVSVTGTPRALSPSPAVPVPLKNIQYSGEPVGGQARKSTLAALSGIPSPTAIASSVRAQPTPVRTTLASVRSAAPKEEDPAKERADVMAAHDIRMGDTYMKRGQYDMALFSFARALAFAPDDQEAQEKIKRARRAKTAEENVLR